MRVIGGTVMNTDLLITRKQTRIKKFSRSFSLKKLQNTKRKWDERKLGRVELLEHELLPYFFQYDITHIIKDQ